MNEKLFTFCQRWLVAMSIASIGLGVLLTVAGATPLFGAYNQSAANAFYAGAPLAGATLQHHQWALSLTGAGTIGWAITLVFVAAVPFKRKERWAWWSIALGVALWVGVDIVASLYWGVTAEVLFAASAGVGLGVPLALTWPAFRARS